MKRVLAVTPWIYDFAFYDAWVLPLGFLRLCTFLQQIEGIEVVFLDCQYGLSGEGRSKWRGDGSGKLHRIQVPKPSTLTNIPRKFCRYGLPDEDFQSLLASLPPVDLILITCQMTYWYQGVVETLSRLRQKLGPVPAILGGLYPALCPEHALKNSGAQVIVTDNVLLELLEKMSDILGITILPGQQTEEIFKQCYPAWNLYEKIDKGAIRTSFGCPFRCSYCIRYNDQQTQVFSPIPQVIAELQRMLSQGIRHIAFYDDALLAKKEKHLKPLLKEVIRLKLNLNFYCPNGLPAALLDEEAAILLKAAGLKGPRLGLETIVPEKQRETGGKVNNHQFAEAVKVLKAAGFQGEEIGAYILAGLPGQEKEEVEESILFCRQIGIRPMLAEYAPVPGTPMFEAEKRIFGSRLEQEPLWHNNSLMPFRNPNFPLQIYQSLKEMASRP